MSFWSAPGCAGRAAPPGRGSTAPRWSWCGPRPALECLLGYLYLRGERERISQLFAVMMEEGEYAT